MKELLIVLAILIIGYGCLGIYFHYEVKKTKKENDNNA